MLHSRNSELQVRWFGALLRSAMFAYLLALVNLSEMKLKK
jgi:hypothetical protein